jgi:hypothetical protein
VIRDCHPVVGMTVPEGKSEGQKYRCRVGQQFQKAKRVSGIEHEPLTGAQLWTVIPSGVHGVWEWHRHQTLIWPVGTR